VHHIRHHFRNHQPAEIIGPEGFIKKQSSLDGAEAEPNEGALAEGAGGWFLYWFCHLPFALCLLTCSSGGEKQVKRQSAKGKGQSRSQREFRSFCLLTSVAVKESRSREALNSSTSRLVLVTRHCFRYSASSWALQDFTARISAVRR